jgi:sugar lactone lactonase YvrE
MATIGTDEPDQRLDPGGMVIDAADDLFVARGSFARYDKVKVFDPNGRVITSFGAPGSGDGQFGFGLALGLAIDPEGGVYVTDGALNRLEKFQLPPELVP